MICVECGAESPRLIGGACTSCHVAKHPLMRHPPILDVELCAHCDARHVGAHWVDPREDEGLDAIRAQAVRAAVAPSPEVLHPLLEIEESAEDERNFLVRLRLEGRVGETPVASSSELRVRMKRGVCDRCSRMFGGYYASVVQLRATDRDPTRHETDLAHRLIGEELDRLRAAGNREAFLSKSEVVPGGHDYLLGEIEAGRIVARVVAQRLGATVTESAKLVGRKEGSDIYRVTFLVRIRLFAPGDFALADGRVVEVLQVTRGRAHAVDLETHQSTKVGEESLRRLGGPEILHRAVVVSRGGSTLQVLDPLDLRTVDVDVPPGWEAEGGEEWVLRHEERLYLPHSRPRFASGKQKKAK